MVDLILVTPTNPGEAAWKDSTLVPASPVGPAGGDLSGAYPNPLVAGLEGIPIEPSAPANGDALLYNGMTNQWEHSPIIFSGGPPTGPAGGDLGGLYPNPGVVGIQGQALSSINTSNGFLKRNAANTAWEEVGYGSVANTVCQGNDARLSDPRSPTGVANGDLSVTYPNPTVDGLQTRPVSPAAPNINDSLVWNGAAWIPQAVGAGSLTAVYGQFISLTDQPLAAATPTVITFDATTGANGVSLVSSTRLQVAASGVYEFSLSLQLLHLGGVNQTIIFWMRQNGVTVPDSASSIEMGNNNNRQLPFVPVILTLTAGQYVEWVIQTSGVNTRVEHFPATGVPPNDIPAIPSVIAGVKRLGA